MIFLLMLSLASVDQVTPPDGGAVLYWSSGLDLAVGNQFMWFPDEVTFSNLAFVWTPITGVIYLSRIEPNMPAYFNVEQVVERGADLCLIGSVPGDQYMWRHVYLVTIPRDPIQWFPVGDLDRDGDVDQADFGLWQLSKPIPLAAMLGAMTGAR